MTKAMQSGGYVGSPLDVPTELALKRQTIRSVFSAEEEPMGM